MTKNLSTAIRRNCSKLLKLECGLVAAMFVMGAEAAKTVDIKAGKAGHWHEAASYEGGELPEEGDTVRVYRLHATANAADCNFLNETGVAKLTLEGDPGDSSLASLTITIDSGVAQLAAGFFLANTSTRYGLVKEGAGRLVIGEIASGSSGAHPVYTVNNGILQLPIGDDYLLRYIGKTTVNHPGVLWPMTPANSGVKTPNNYILGLFGDGVVSNPVEWATNVRIENAIGGASSSFSGRLGGNIVLSVRDDRTVSLTGTSSITNTVAVNGSARLYLGAFGGGVGNEPTFGSAGSGRFAVGKSATLGYLGESEVSYAQIANTIDKDIARSFTLDGGPNGGLDFAGSIDLSQTTNATVNLILSGTNRQECILSGSVKGSSSATRAMRLVKRGEGTWQVKENASSGLNGVVAVEEGKIRVDSLAQTDRNCAIGTAKLLMEDYGGAYDATRLLPYAILLGDEGKCGTLAYAGTGAATVTSRLIGLLGDGGLDSETAAVCWNGVTAAAPGNHKLVLGGSAEGSVLNNVSNGVGQVSITKEGSGDWTLGGNLDFTGGIKVESGRLAISSAMRPYTWFKVLFTEAYNGGRRLDVGRFGLFNSEGTMQCANLVTNDAALSDMSILKPGEVAFCGIGATPPGYTTGSNLQTLFLRTKDSFLRVDTTTAPRLDDDSTWFGFVLRPPAGIDPITSYDVGTRWATNYAYTGNVPQSWKVYGSEDGLDWKELSTIVSNRVWEGAHTSWIKGGMLYFSDARKNVDPDAKNPDGWPISGGIQPGSTLAGGIDNLSVATNATLTTDTTVTTRRVTVDFTGMGTVTGFALAEGGVIDIVNAPDHGAFEVAADFSGIALPANYSFLLNGESTWRRIKFSGDGTRIVGVQKGVTINFR